jgi:hypothetical protein
VLEADVYAALAGLTRTPSLFFPQDGDTLAAKATATWTLLSPARVSIRVLDRDGNVVRTGPTDKAFAAGTARWAWNGRDDAGAFAARGLYQVVVTAGNGEQSATQRVSVRADAFRLSTSVETAVRGSSFVVTAVTAERLGAAPRVLVRQPGMDPWTVTMTARSASTWTAVVTPRKRGTAGMLSLVVRGRDTAGGVNASTIRLVLD